MEISRKQKHLSPNTARALLGSSTEPERHMTETDNASRERREAQDSLGLSEVQQDGLRFLGDLFRDEPAIHPGAALALLCDLTERLGRCALSPQPDWRTHAELLRIAQTCVDAAQDLERHLGGEAPFTWERLERGAQVRIDDVSQRLTQAERRLKRMATENAREDFAVAEVMA